MNFPSTFFWTSLELLMNLLWMSSLWTPFEFIVNVSRTSHELLAIVYEPPTNVLWTSCKHFMTSHKRLMQFVQTSYELRANFLWTSCKLLVNFLWTSGKLLTNFLWTYKLISFSQSYYEFHTNFLWTSY